MVEQTATIQQQQKQVKLTIENSVKLDPQYPIPINYGSDSFAILSNLKYIPFLGKKDNLPNLLLEARLTSPTQNACISSICSCTIGNGLIIPDVETINKDFDSWRAVINNKRQSLNEILLMALDGERTYGNFFLEIKRGSVGNKKFVKLYKRTMLECRLGEENDDGEVENVLISKRFAKAGGNYRNRVKDATVIPLWSDNPLDNKKVWKKNNDGTESTMLHFKNEVSGIEHYGLSESIAGLRYQVLEGNSAQFNIDNFENNMVLGGMLIFKSAMTQEEAQTNAKEILLSHIGEGKTGRIAVIASESGLKDVEFVSYNTQKEGSYIEFDKRIEEKIVTSNNWDSTLAGINRSSSLGNGSSYIRSIYDVKDAVLLNPLRLRIIEKLVNPIAKIYAEWTGAKEVAEYKFGFEADMPFSLLGDLKPEQFMKVKEARELANLEADDSVGEKYIFEVLQKNNNSNVPGKPPSEEGANNNR